MDKCSPLLVRVHYDGGEVGRKLTKSSCSYVSCQHDGISVRSEFLHQDSTPSEV